MLRPHPSLASWATDPASPPGLRGLYVRASVCRVTSSDAGQHYRGKLGDSAGRTLTDWVYGFTGCTLILQTLVNPDVPCRGNSSRLSDDRFEFFAGPYHPVSDFRHNDNLVLGETIYAVGVPRSPIRYALDVKTSAEDG